MIISFLRRISGPEEREEKLSASKNKVMIRSLMCYIYLFYCVNSQVNLYLVRMDVRAEGNRDDKG